MTQQFLQLLLNGLITGTVLALTGVGATLVFGIQQIANFAHGELLTFGAYVGLLLNVALGQNIVVAALAAMFATGVLALAVHLAVLHPLRGRGLVATSLITVGLGLMLRDTISLAAGSELHAYRLDQSVVYDLGLIRISPGQAIAVALAVVVTPALTLLLARTRRWASRCAPPLTTVTSPRSPASMSIASAARFGCLRARAGGPGWRDDRGGPGHLRS